MIGRQRFGHERECVQQIGARQRQVRREDRIIVNRRRHKWRHTQGDRKDTQDEAECDGAIRRLSRAAGGGYTCESQNQMSEDVIGREQF